MQYANVQCNISVVPKWCASWHRGVPRGVAMCAAKAMYTTYLCDITEKCAANQKVWEPLQYIMGRVMQCRCGLRYKLSERVDQPVIICYGYMERMSEERLVKRIYRVGLDGARERGRTRTGPGPRIS